MKDIKHTISDFIRSPRPYPKGGGVLRVDILSFLNMVMWRIKKGLISRPGYMEKYCPRIKLVTLGWG